MRHESPRGWRRRRVIAGAVHALAGKAAPEALLVDVPMLITAYFTDRPDPGIASQRIAFGTSGHRGSSLRSSFNEAHVLAISQAICMYRRAQGIAGPLFLGWDTHALSEPARISALEVFAANDVHVMLDADEGPTPTPVVSHAILVHNRARGRREADGVVITPSHNPPEYGGFKYDPPSGGPAADAVTRWIQEKANALLDQELRAVRRAPWDRTRRSPLLHRHDYLRTYVDDLEGVIDADVIRGSALHVGVDPLGGASVRYWAAIGDRYGLRLDVVNRSTDATFRFMAVDHDGVIRMDPSSRHAMAPLISLRDRFDLAFANDPDADRFGIVSRSAGLLDPNFYLAACGWYLFRERRAWRRDAAFGKTVVTTSLIDRVAARLGRPLVDVPVGFKHFVNGLLDGSLGLAGEESAGASFLRRDGTAWSTDKDGLIMALLAIESTARLGRDPGEQYHAIVRELGEPFYQRIDRPATAETKARLARIGASDVRATTLAGDAIRDVRTAAPGNQLPIGGIKVVTDRGWFAARPSGTEDVYKLYAESFESPRHLERIQEEADAIIEAAVAQKADDAGVM